MTTYDQFHDGSLDGLLIEETSVAIFLSTEENGRFVLVAKDVMAMTANGFLAGNIIFEVAVRESTELTSRDIRDAYHLHNAHNATVEEAQIEHQLQKAR